jgi:hypothetical protein
VRSAALSASFSRRPTPEEQQHKYKHILSENMLWAPVYWLEDAGRSQTSTGCYGIVNTEANGKHDSSHHSLPLWRMDHDYDAVSPVGASLSENQ